jgi:RNA recognition motif-containing protein
VQVFCGNFEYDAPERAILDLFEKYGVVHRIDMKTGEPLDASEGQGTG